MILLSHGKRRLSEEALFSGLFIKGWMLEEHLQSLCQTRRNKRNIVLAKTDRGTPMGCLVSIPVLVSVPDLRFKHKKVLRHQRRTVLMFYVVPRFRRQGVGKAMYAHWKTKHPDCCLLGLRGKQGSIEFFRNLRVSTRLTYDKTKKTQKKK